MFATQLGLVGVVRFEPPEILDRGRQAGAVEQMAGGVLVSAGAAFAELPYA
jgi:hypothetical protein